MSCSYVPLIFPSKSAGLCPFFDRLCEEASQLNLGFISDLALCKRNQSELCSVAEKFCKDLQHSFEQAAYLPPSPSKTCLHVRLTYNLLYASFLKARCTQQHHPDVLSSHALHVFVTLRRVGEEFGLVTLTPELAFTDTVQEVNSILQIVFKSLSDVSAHNTDLGPLLQNVGMLTCMWSLLTLLEKGVSSPLPWLSFLADSLPAVDKVDLKHGFLVEKTNSQETSVGLVQNFAALLLAVSFFHQGDLKECKERASKVAYPHWKPLANILTARALIEGKHESEAFMYLWNIWADSRDSTSLSPVVMCEIYKLLASCNSSQGWKYTPLELLRLCLQCHSESQTALYMVAQHFNKLLNAEAEIEFLRKLVKVSEKSESREKTNTEQLPLLDDLFHDLIFLEYHFSFAQAIYLLAQRAAELKRYEESSQAYMKLIELYRLSRGSPKTRPCHPSVNLLPDLLTVCLQAAQTLLNVPWNSQCLQLCDRVLIAISASDFSSKIISSRIGRQFHSSQDHTLLSDSMNVSVADTSVYENFPSHTLRFEAQGEVFSEGDGFDSKEEEPQWKDIENRTLLMVCKAECLLAEGDTDAAVDVLTRAHRQLTDSWQSLPVTVPGSCWKPLAAGCVSGQKDYAGSEKTRPKETAEGSEQQEHSYFQLCHQLYVYLSDALCRCGQFRQALPLARRALCLRPDRTETQYFAYNAVVELGQDQNSVKEWLRHRGLPHHSDQYQLQLVIRQKEQTRTCFGDEQNVVNRQRLGQVTERDLLLLDLKCLKILAESSLSES